MAYPGKNGRTVEFYELMTLAFVFDSKSDLLSDMVNVIKNNDVNQI